MPCVNINLLSNFGKKLMKNIVHKTFDACQHVNTISITTKNAETKVSTEVQSTRDTHIAQSLFTY